jgi:hypothetical protein
MGVHEQKNYNLKYNFMFLALSKLFLKISSSITVYVYNYTRIVISNNVGHDQVLFEYRELNKLTCLISAASASCCKPSVVDGEDNPASVSCLCFFSLIFADSIVFTGP